MFSSFCKLSLTLILKWLALFEIPARGRILPPARPALPAAPIKSAAPPIDLTPDQVEQIAVAEGVAKIQALQFEAIPVITPAFGGEPLSRTAPDPVKIVSWTELPQAVPDTDTPAQNLSPAPVPPDCETPTPLTRGQLVEGLLDEAWQQGLRTYAQLMKYIELQTGTACSKRVVSAWKKSRQRTEAEAA